jgi:ferredoxin
MIFNKKYKVIIKNKNITIEAKSGSNLYKLLQEHNIIVPTLCSGNGQCGKCKVHVSSEQIQKPTKKERLILAIMSLDEGYRLACQYIIKSDIIINTETFIDTNSTEILDIKIIGETKENSDSDKNKINDLEGKNNEQSEVDQKTIQKDNAKLENHETTQEKQLTKQNKQIIENNSCKPEEKEDKPIIDMPDDEFNPTDGLLLIQYARGIKFYLYSAGINNISADGFIKTDENIVDLIDNNSICDFIYNCTDIRDIERIFIILNKQYYKGKSYLGLINYYSFELGTLLCEIIQPENKPSDILTFLRLIRIKNNNLIFHLDNLDNVFFVKDSTIIHLNCNYLTEDFNINDLIELGNNPIESISDDLLTISVPDNLLPPTGINFTTLLKAISLLDKYGIIDHQYKLQDRNELLDKIPLDLLVKLSSRDGIKKFFLYRKNKTEIGITQKTLDKLFLFREFILSLINYTEKNIGKIDFITFDTINKFENMSNEFLNLNIIPSKYSNKLIHLTGDPTIFAKQFFSEKTLSEYINKNYTNFKEIELYKDNNFK